MDSNRALTVCLAIGFMWQHWSILIFSDIIGCERNDIPYWSISILMPLRIRKSFANMAFSLLFNSVGIVASAPSPNEHRLYTRILCARNAFVRLYVTLSTPPINGLGRLCV